MSSNFEERSGIVSSAAPWGRWYQTVATVHIEVNVAANTRSKAVSVNVKPTTIKLAVNSEVIIEGPLFDKVVADETVWTLEDGPKTSDSSTLPGKLIHILLTKLGGGNLGPKKWGGGGGEGAWESLLQKSGDSPTFAADPWTLRNMRQKIDLERFELQYPGFDFSSAKLSGS